MYSSQSSKFVEDSSPGTLSNRRSANKTRVSSEESAFDSKTSAHGVRESRTETSDNDCSVSENKVSREETTLAERTTEAGTDSLTEEPNNQTSVAEIGDCRRHTAIQTSETEVCGSSTDQPRTSVPGTEDIHTDRLSNKTLDAKTKGCQDTELDRNEKNREDRVRRSRELSIELNAVKYGEDEEEAMMNDLREMEEFLNQLVRMRNHGVIGVCENREPESRETELENSSSDENVEETTGGNDAISENNEEQNEDIKQDINTMEALLKQLIQMRSKSMKPTDATHTADEQKSSEVDDNDFNPEKQPPVENQAPQDMHISQETRQSHDEQTSPQNDLRSRHMQDHDCVMATMSKQEMLRNRWRSEPPSKIASLKDISRCASLDATGTRSDACHHQSHESSCPSSHRENNESNNDSDRSSSIETLHSSTVGSSTRTPSSDVFHGLSFVRHLTPSNRGILQNILKVMNIMARNPDQNLYLVTSRLPRLPSKPSYITHVFEISTKNKRRRKTSAASSNPSRISCPSYFLPTATDTCSCPSNLLPLPSDKCQKDEDVWFEDFYTKSEAQCANNNCQHGRGTRTISLPTEISTCLQNSLERMQTPCVKASTNGVCSALSSKKSGFRDHRIVASESLDAYTDKWDELKKVSFADVPLNSYSTKESARESIESQTTSEIKHNSLSQDDSAKSEDDIEQSQPVFKTMQFPLSLFNPPMSNQVTSPASNDDVKLTQETHNEQMAIDPYQNERRFIAGSITHVVTRARNTDDNRSSFVDSTEKWTTRVHNRNLFSAIKSCGTRCRLCGAFHSSVDASKRYCHIVNETSFVSRSSSGVDEIELTANDSSRIKETQSDASDSSDYGFCHPEIGCRKDVGKKSVVIGNRHERKSKAFDT